MLLVTDKNALEVFNNAYSTILFLEEQVPASRLSPHRVSPEDLVGLQRWTFVYTLLKAYVTGHLGGSKHASIKTLRHAVYKMYFTGRPTVTQDPTLLETWAITSPGRCRSS